MNVRLHLRNGGSLVLDRKNSETWTSATAQGRGDLLREFDALGEVDERGRLVHESTGSVVHRWAWLECPICHGTGIHLQARERAPGELVSVQCHCPERPRRGS